MYGYGKELMPYNKDCLVNLIKSELKKQRENSNSTQVEEKINNGLNKCIE